MDKKKENKMYIVKTNYRGKECADMWFEYYDKAMRHFDEQERLGFDCVLLSSRSFDRATVVWTKEDEKFHRECLKSREKNNG